MTHATGVGSWPGASVREALRAVRDLLADPGLPYLPETPARGPGADVIGRSAGLLVDLHVDLQPMGWRFVDRPGRDASRTAALLREDLDELAEAYDGYSGRLKVQVAGPWTLAAQIWLTRGERALVDLGACRDLADSLAAGLGAHLATVERLVPGAEVVVQVDEPSLPAVLAGRLPTASGFGRVRVVDPQVATDALRRVLEGAGARHTLVHCCDATPPLPMLRAVGASGLSLDTTLLTARGWEGVAVAVDEGMTLYAGCLPSAGRSPRVTDVVAGLERRWDELGLDADGLARVVVTSSCGLSGATEEEARALTRTATQVADELTEISQG